VISLDSNLLLYAYNADAPLSARAARFLEAMNPRDDVVLSEFTLVEFYRLLRNPAVLSKPLSAGEAAAVITQFRQHPYWRVAGFPASDSTALHDELWRLACVSRFAFRRIFDARLALVLRAYGVTEFATANVKDFQGFGFRRVWNPLEEANRK
jgi:toxin-antitoxin system PIN domain toxin